MTSPPCQKTTAFLTCKTSYVRSRRFPGFDDKIISMYARGMSTREITGHLRELYGIDVWPSLISTVTDAVLDEVAAWQARPLDPTIGQSWRRG